MNVKDILADPNFQGLPEQERLKVLRTVDPNFAGLPESEQLKVIGAKLVAVSPAPEGMKQVAPIADLVGQAMADQVLMEQGLPIVSQEMLPDIETVAGMAAGAKGSAGITTPLTGLSMAGAGLIKRGFAGQGETIGPSDQVLMEQGLPIVSQEMLRDFGIGAGLDIAGRGVAKIAGKLLAPAANKLTEEMKYVIDWAKQKKLPLPADITKTWMGQAAENMPELGLGGFLMDVRRRKLAEGLNDAVAQIAGEIGLPVKAPSEIGQDIASVLRGMVSGSGEYTAFKAALKKLPQDIRYPMDNLEDALFSIGERATGAGGKNIIKAGLEAVERVYGKRAPELVEAFKEIVENGFTASPQNIETINDLIWKGTYGRKKGFQTATEQARGLAERLKGGDPERGWTGLIDDMETIMIPNGQSLGALNEAKNTAYKEAMEIINAVNPELKMLYKPGQRWEITNFESNLKSATERLFRPGFETKALMLKDTLQKVGRNDVWDAAKMAWIQKAFDNSIFKKGDELFFSPKKYQTWFKENKTYISRIMPEQLESLNNWNIIAANLEKDIGRFAESKGRSALRSFMSMGGGLTSFLTGGPGGIIIPQAFSMISALSTMPYTGFVRHWLTKSGSPMAAPLIGQATKAAGIERMAE